MQIHSHLTTDIILSEVGERIRDYRMEKALTQKDLGEKAGLSRKSIVKAESGGIVTLESIVMVLRALGRLGDLNQLLPERTKQLDPFEVLETQKNKQQRVRHSSDKMKD